MLHTYRRLVALLFVALAVSFALGMAVLLVSAQPAQTVTPTQHCLADIHSDNAANTQVCFDTFAEVFNYVTEGELNLAPDTPVQEVIDAYNQWALANQDKVQPARSIPLP